MAKYKQSYLRLPTEYRGINVEVSSLKSCIQLPPTTAFTYNLGPSRTVPCWHCSLFVTLKRLRL